MKKFYNSFKEMSSLELVEVERSLFNYLDDSRSAWDDKNEFYSSTADDFEPSYVDEAWNDEGESLGQCINVNSFLHVSYTRENWVRFSEIFEGAMLRVRKSNED